MLNILCVDVQHVVVPRVILHPKPRRAGDVLDIFEERRLDSCVACRVGDTADGSDAFKNAAFAGKLEKAFSAVIPECHRTVLDRVDAGGKLTSEIQVVNKNRLTQSNRKAVHVRLFLRRYAPCSVVFRKHERLHINIVNNGFPARVGLGGKD